MILISFHAASNWTEEISTEGFHSFSHINKDGNLSMVSPQVNICWDLIITCLMMDKFNFHSDQFCKVNFIDLYLLHKYKLFCVLNEVCNRYLSVTTKCTIWYLCLLLCRRAMEDSEKLELLLNWGSSLKLSLRAHRYRGDTILWLWSMWWLIAVSQSIGILLICNPGCLFSWGPRGSVDVIPAKVQSPQGTTP